MRQFHQRIGLLIAQSVWVCGLPVSLKAADQTPQLAEKKGSMTVRSNNEFACDLYRTAENGEGNLFFSPTSIAAVLGVIAEGAKGRTKTEFHDVLHLASNGDGDDKESIFLRTLDRSGEGFRLKSASRIWGRKGLKIDANFRRVISTKYSADFEELDFSAPQTVQEKLDDWVDDRTNGKISKLFAGPLSPDAELIATNAIYFKGNWIHRFDPTFTKNQKFFGRSLKEMEVPMMGITNRFRFWQSPTLKAIELPYEGDTYSAVVLLPSARDGLSDLKKEVTLANLEMWFSNLDRSVDSKSKEPPEVMVRLPRFSFSAEMQLNKVLQQLKLKLAFGPSADLTGIANEPLYLSTIIHKAFVQVDEKGTVAAAITGGVASSSVPPFFVADHPFVFLIRDRESGLVLFLGCVEDPREGTAGVTKRNEK